MTLNISVSELLGNEYYIHLNWQEVDLISKCRVRKHYSDNEPFTFVFDLNTSHVFDPISEEVIL